jgi:multiple sugar transport system ATP-binding protein
MDEPLSNLDAKLRVQMRREIIHLQRNLSTTTIYVTHDQVEAMTMGDRITVMRAGKVQQIGAPEVLYNYPANLFVGQFIGSPAMNAFPARLQAENGNLMVVTDFGRFPVGSALAARLKPDPRASSGARDIICGIRAEDIVLGGGPGATGNLEARVDLVEDLGADAHVSLTVGDVVLVARTAAENQPVENTMVTIGFNPNELHLFDAATEETLLLRQ